MRAYRTQVNQDKRSRINTNVLNTKCQNTEVSQHASVTISSNPAIKFCQRVVPNSRFITNKPTANRVVNTRRTRQCRICSRSRVVARPLPSARRGRRTRRRVCNLRLWSCRGRRLRPASLRRIHAAEQRDDLVRRSSSKLAARSSNGYTTVPGDKRISTPPGPGTIRRLVPMSMMLCMRVSALSPTSAGTLSDSISGAVKVPATGGPQWSGKQYDA